VKLQGVHEYPLPYGPALEVRRNERAVEKTYHHNFGWHNKNTCTLSAQIFAGKSTSQSAIPTSVFPIHKLVRVNNPSIRASKEIFRRADIAATPIKNSLGHNSLLKAKRLARFNLFMIIKNFRSGDDVVAKGFN
jgi:hypothetical protein